MLHADEVLLAVEIVSPGSKRTDYVTKHDEYAPAVTGVFAATEPFPVKLDLAVLTA
jgi:hypothetical protein